MGSLILKHKGTLQNTYNNDAALRNNKNKSKRIYAETYFRYGILRSIP